MTCEAIEKGLLMWKKLTKKTHDSVLMQLIFNKRERKLLLFAALCFLLLIVVEARLPLLDFLSGTPLGAVLTNNALARIASSLFVGIIAAYLFYLLVDYYPRKENEGKSLQLLNKLVASVLDTYNGHNIFGHEVALPFVQTTFLELDWLNKTIEEVRADKPTYLQLLVSMQTAHSRLEDFRNSLVLAANICPKHAMQWLVLIDKLKLFAELYDKRIYVPQEKIGLVDSESECNPVLTYKRDLKFRFLEFLEASRDWVKLQAVSVSTNA